MAEATDAPGARRTFGPSVLAGLAGGALVAVAGSRAWVEPAGEAAGGFAAQQLQASDTGGGSPLATAVALVVLASWGVVLVARGRFRRAVTWLGAVAAIALLAVVASSWWTAPRDFRDDFATLGVSDADLARTAWAWLALLGALVALAAAASAVHHVGGWPEMGRRYDAPTAAPAPSTDGETSHLDLWRSLDEGNDPTERPDP